MRNIRPLFREKAVSLMSMAFDLASYKDVRANTDRILDALGWVDALRRPLNHAHGSEPGRVGEGV